MQHKDKLGVVKHKLISQVYVSVSKRLLQKPTLCPQNELGNSAGHTGIDLMLQNQILDLLVKFGQLQELQLKS